MSIVIFWAQLLLASDHHIYEIVHSLPLGDGKAVSNYYVNLGERDGITPGVVLSVHRLIAVSDNFGLNNLDVKVGELEIVWSDSKNAVAIPKAWANKDVYLDIGTPMIGDRVTVQVL
jgi:hypothetical protein